MGVSTLPGLPYVVPLEAAPPGGSVELRMYGDESDNPCLLQADFNGDDGAYHARNYMDLDDVIISAPPRPANDIRSLELSIKETTEATIEHIDRERERKPVHPTPIGPEETMYVAGLLGDAEPMRRSAVDLTRMVYARKQTLDPPVEDSVRAAELFQELLLSRYGETPEYTRIIQSDTPITDPSHDFFAVSTGSDPGQDSRPHVYITYQRALLPKEKEAALPHIIDEAHPPHKYSIMIAYTTADMHDEASGTTQAGLVAGYSVYPVDTAGRKLKEAQFAQVICDQRDLDALKLFLRDPQIQRQRPKPT